MVYLLIFKNRSKPETLQGDCASFPDTDEEGYEESTGGVEEENSGGVEEESIGRVEEESTSGVEEDDEKFRVEGCEEEMEKKEECDVTSTDNTALH